MTLPLPRLAPLAGDSSGCIHIISMAHPRTRPAPAAVGTAALTKLGTQLVLDGDVTALAFGCGFPSVTGSVQDALPLLAVGGRRGSAKVLRVQPDGRCTLVASLAGAHKAPISGVAFTSTPGSLGAATGLATTDRDGKRLLHRWDAAADQMQLVASAAVPRCSFTALTADQHGTALVAASKAGRAYTWETAAGAEAGSVQLLDRTHGEFRDTCGELGVSGLVDSACNLAMSSFVCEPIYAPVQGLAARSPLCPLPMPSTCRRGNLLCSGLWGERLCVRHQPQPPAGLQPTIWAAACLWQGTHGWKLHQQGGCEWGCSCEQGESWGLHGWCPKCSVGLVKAPVLLPACPQVLILPSAGCIVTVGEDAAVLTHRLPTIISSMFRRTAEASGQHRRTNSGGRNE